MASPYSDIGAPLESSGKPAARQPRSRTREQLDGASSQDPVARALELESASRMGSDLAVAALVELGHSPPKAPAGQSKEDGTGWVPGDPPVQGTPFWSQSNGSPSILKKKRSSPRQPGGWVFLGFVMLFVNLILLDPCDQLTCPTYPTAFNAVSDPSRLIAVGWVREQASHLHDKPELHDTDLAGLFQQQV